MGKEVFDLWRLETSDGENISGHFSPNEFPAVLHQTKPINVPGLKYICPEFHAGPALKYWLSSFRLSTCGTIKFKNVKKSFCRRDPSLQAPFGDPKSYRP